LRFGGTAPLYDNDKPESALFVIALHFAGNFLDSKT
jgi:hypothetical protein